MIQSPALMHLELMTLMTMRYVEIMKLAMLLPLPTLVPVPLPMALCGSYNLSRHMEDDDDIFDDPYDI